MFAKVHPAEDVKSGNTGSCHDLVRYLEKETGEGQRFFSHTEQDISPERVTTRTVPSCTVKRTFFPA